MHPASLKDFHAALVPVSGRKLGKGGIHFKFTSNPFQIYRYHTLRQEEVTLIDS